MSRLPAEQAAGGTGERLAEASRAIDRWARETLLYALARAVANKRPGLDAESCQFLIDGLTPLLVEWDEVRVAALAAPSAPPSEPLAGTREPNPLDVLGLARLAAKRHHYALCVHGSLARDVDFVAVPWRDDASEPAVMVEAVRKAVGGTIMVADDSPDVGREGYYRIDDASKHSPVGRPHGRLAWSIYGVLGGAYIDLSVMSPRAASAPPEKRTEPTREYLLEQLDRVGISPPEGEGEPWTVTTDEPEPCADGDELEDALRQTARILCAPPETDGGFDWLAFVEQQIVASAAWHEKGGSWIVGPQTLLDFVRAARPSPGARTGETA